MNDALRDIIGYAAAGRFRIEPHCRVRMRERGSSVEDVRYALVNAESCTGQPNGRWKVKSSDLDGDELTMIVVLQSGVIVVTLF